MKDGGGVGGDGEGGSRRRGFFEGCIHLRSGKKEKSFRAAKISDEH